MIDIKELKLRLNIEDVARDYGLTFDPKGWTRCHFSERHAHGDSNPSLHLDRERQRITCHSQKCFGEDGADVVDLVKILDKINTGAAVRKLAEKAGMGEMNGKARKGSAQPRQLIVATFDYKDEFGNLLYQIVRKEPGKNGRSKDFGVRQPDGKGWKWSAEGVRPIPYCLPDLLASEGPVVVVEGELHADALWKMDFPATTNAFGAGTWRDDYNVHLKDRPVIIWPDKDDAGHRHAQQVAQSLSRTGHAESVRIVEPPEALPEKGDVLDGLKLGWTREDVQRILDDAQPWEPPQDEECRAELKLFEASGSTDAPTSEAPEGDEEEEDEPKRENQADRLVKLALHDAILFHDQTQQPYALVSIGDHYETLRCHSRGFRRWLSRRFYEAEEKAVGGEAVASALNVIEAKACFDGERHELHNRVALHDSAIWYDLTDPKWRTVRVTPGGWQVIENPPILFVRYDHHAPQVEPIRGGDVHRLFDFVAVNGDGPRLLLLVYLVSCFVPDIPHPVPVLHGPQGSGKSSTFRILRRLIDPSAVEILSFPRDNNELVQKLAHHWAALFDNVSTLQGWESDTLCRAVTGEGFTKRQLYSDDDDIIYSFRRCVGLNGINCSATKPDLLDRSILIALDRIPPNQRRTEAALQTAFESARPHILGGIFDVLAEAMRMLPEVRLSTLPRMADFARWGSAIAQALGYRQGDFLRAYNENIREQNAEVLEGHPVAAAVLALTEGGEAWEGTPSDLLTEFERVAVDRKINTKEKGWPKSGPWVTRRLNEVRPNLADVGITIDTGKSGDRKITIRKGPQNTVHTALLSTDDKKQGVADGQQVDSIVNTVRIPSIRNSLQDNGQDSKDGMDGKIPTLTDNALKGGKL